MWNGVRNGIIMRNTIYAGNELTEERILFSRQFYKSSSFSMLRTITVNPGHAWTIFLKFERSFEIYMSVLKITNEISGFPYKFP